MRTSPIEIPCCFVVLSSFLQNAPLPTSVLLSLCVLLRRTPPTLYSSASFMSKTLVVGGAAYKYQIWDTAGQEKYHSLAPMYYRNAAAALLVYDITNSKTFATLKAWVRELRELGPEGLTIVLCGNKSDLEAKRVSYGGREGGRGRRDFQLRAPTNCGT